MLLVKCEFASFSGAADLQIGAKAGSTSKAGRDLLSVFARSGQAAGNDRADPSGRCRPSAMRNFLRRRKRLRT